MTVVSSKEFATRPARYYNMAVNERVVIRRGKNMFHLVFSPFEKAKEQVYYEQDYDEKKEYMQLKTAFLNRSKRSMAQQIEKYLS